MADKMCDQAMASESSKSDGKRSLEDEGETGSYREGFKKARYSWQIKGRSYLDGNNVQHTPSMECKSKVNEKQSYIDSSTSDSTNNSIVTGLHTELSENAKAFHSHEAASVPVSDTKTKFEMLREVRSGYSERVEEFLKSQANRFECDQDSDDIISEDESEKTTLQHRHVQESNSMDSQGHSSRSTNRGRLSFDSPQLNQHLFNISSWLWQKQELGCAIVDNVFNRTLEELGLSPDPEANLQATTRLSVENQSIEAAINHQGLAVNSGMNDDTIDSTISTEGSETDVANMCEADQPYDQQLRCCNDTTVKVSNKNACDKSNKVENCRLEAINSEQQVSQNKNNQSPKPTTVQETLMKSSNNKCVPNLEEDNSNSNPNININENQEQSMTANQQIKQTPSLDDIMDVTDNSVTETDNAKNEDVYNEPANIFDIAVSASIMSKGLNIR